MRIEIGGKYALDKFGAGFVLERWRDEATATKRSIHHEKGDIIPGAWVALCCPHDVSHAARIIAEDIVKNERGVFFDADSFISQYKRTVEALCDAIGVVVPTT